MPIPASPPPSLSLSLPTSHLFVRDRPPRRKKITEGTSEWAPGGRRMHMLLGPREAAWGWAGGGEVRGSICEPRLGDTCKR